MNKKIDRNLQLQNKVALICKIEMWQGINHHIQKYFSMETSF